MIEFYSTKTWQEHHLFFVSVGNVGFDAHFLAMIIALGTFVWWSRKPFAIKTEDTAKEMQKKMAQWRNELRVVAVVVAFMFSGLLVSYFLDVVDYHASNSVWLKEFIENIEFDQERVFGIGLDAFSFGLVDLICMVVLANYCKRPRGMIDALLLVYMLVVMWHLLAASINFSTVKSRMLYDVVWQILYYMIIVTIFLTSERARRRYGDLRVFAFGHFLFSHYRKVSIHKPIGRHRG